MSLRANLNINIYYVRNQQRTNSNNCSQLRHRRCPRRDPLPRLRPRPHRDQQPQRSQRALSPQLRDHRTMQVQRKLSLLSTQPRSYAKLYPSLKPNNSTAPSAPTATSLRTPRRPCFSRLSRASSTPDWLLALVPDGSCAGLCSFMDMSTRASRRVRDG